LKKFWHRQGLCHSRACMGMHRRTRAELPISHGTTTPSPRTVRLARRARVMGKEERESLFRRYANKLLNITVFPATALNVF
jgi:hypothetical protein